MRRRWTWTAVAVLAFVAQDGLADPMVKAKTVTGLTALSTERGDSAAALAGSLRTILLESLPDPLYEGSQGWGKTKEVLVGFQVKTKGFQTRLEAKYSPRNHGTWRKGRVTSRNLPGSLAVEVRDVKKPEPGRTTFSVTVALDGAVDYQQQKWASGIRLYDASVRARFRVKLVLQCEMTFRVNKTGGLLPDAVFRLRVLQSDLRFDNIVCEHFAGFGGSTARMIGDLITANLRKYRPDLERRLLDRANAAIVKAGDTKEVRIGLGKLLAASR
jgi:hypothetical protein